MYPSGDWRKKRGPRTGTLPSSGTGRATKLFTRGDAVPTPKITRNSRLVRPRHSRLREMPATTWLASRVMTKKPSTIPSRIPLATAASTPSQRLCMKKPATKPTRLPTIIMPSIPMFSTPERSL